MYGDLCEVCGVPDTETHFVLECDQFDYIRDRFIPLYYRSRPCMQTLCEILEGEDRRGLNGLAQYLRRANLIKKESYRCLKTKLSEVNQRLDETFMMDC